MSFPTSEGKLPYTLEVNTACECGATRVLTVSAVGYRMWRAGEPIQRALPELFPSDRELLISGTCGACWNELWAIYVGLGQELEPVGEGA